MPKFLHKALVYLITSYIVISPITPAVQVVQAQNINESGSELTTNIQLDETNDTGTEISTPTPLPYGTHEIEVCFVNLDEKGQILDNLPIETSVTLPLYLSPIIKENTGLPESYGSDRIDFEMDEDITNNAHLWSPNGKNDAYCDTYEIEVPANTDKIAYAYGEAEITDPLNDWFKTRYHDGYQSDFNHPNDAERYSSELFTDGDINDRNNLSDGHINLYSANDERRIVVVNKIEKRVFPKVVEVCFVTVDRTGSYIDGSHLTEGTRFEIDLFGDIPLGGNKLPIRANSGLYETASVRAPYKNNTSIFSDGIDDAHCQEITLITRNEDIAYSDALTFSDLVFNETEYTDENTGKATGLESFSTYSGELYDEVPGNENERNRNSDGHIKMAENGNSRRLLVLNQLDHADLNFDVEYVNQNDEIIDYVNYKEGIYGRVTLRESVLEPKSIRFSNDGFNWNPNYNFDVISECNDHAYLCNVWDGRKLQFEVDSSEIHEGINHIFVEVTDQENNIYIKKATLIYDNTAPDPDVVIKIGNRPFDLTNPASTNELNNYVTYQVTDNSQSDNDPYIQLSDIEYAGIYEVRFGSSASNMESWISYQNDELESFLRSWSPKDVNNSELAIFFQARDKAGNESKFYVDTINYFEQKTDPLTASTNLSSSCISPNNTGGDPFGGLNINDFETKRIVVNIDVLTQKEDSLIFNEDDSTLIDPTIIAIEHNPKEDNYVFYGLAYPTNKSVSFGINNYEETFQCNGGNCNGGWKWYPEKGNLSRVSVELFKNNWERLNITDTVDSDGRWTIEVERSKINPGDNIFAEYIFETNESFDLATKYSSSGDLEKESVSLRNLDLEDRKTFSAGVEAPSLCLPPKPVETPPCDYSDLYGMRDVCEANPKDTFHDFIRPLIEQGVLDGYSDGNFYQENIVNREQMAKFIVNAFEIDINLNCTPFPDVTRSNVFYEYITTLKCEEIVSGYSNGRYEPKNLVDRAEVTKFVVNGARIPLNTTCSMDFKDLATANPFHDYIKTLYCNTIINGYTKLNEYRPWEDLQRNQLSKIVLLARECALFGSCPGMGASLGGESLLSDTCNTYGIVEYYISGTSYEPDITSNILEPRAPYPVNVYMSRNGADSHFTSTYESLGGIESDLGWPVNSYKQMYFELPFSASVTRRNQKFEKGEMLDSSLIYFDSCDITYLERNKQINDAIEVKIINGTPFNSLIELRDADYQRLEDELRSIESTLIQIDLLKANRPEEILKWERYENKFESIRVEINQLTDYLAYYDFNSPEIPYDLVYYDVQSVVLPSADEIQSVKDDIYITYLEGVPKAIYNHPDLFFSGVSDGFKQCINESVLNPDPYGDFQALRAVIEQAISDPDFFVKLNQSITLNMVASSDVDKAIAAGEFLGEAICDYASGKLDEMKDLSVDRIKLKFDEFIEMGKISEAVDEVIDTIPNNSRVDVIDTFDAPKSGIEEYIEILTLLERDLSEKADKKFQDKFEKYKQRKNDKGETHLEFEPWKKKYLTVANNAKKGAEFEIEFKNKYGGDKPVKKEISTPLGGRRIDNAIEVDGILIARELKSGDVRYTKSIQDQINKDIYIRQGEIEGFEKIEWHLSKDSRIDKKSFDRFEEEGIPVFRDGALVTQHDNF